MNCWWRQQDALAARRLPAVSRLPAAAVMDAPTGLCMLLRSYYRSSATLLFL